MSQTYCLQMIGGPLDGVDRFYWRWDDTELGREGEATGDMFFGRSLHYRCNSEKTQAFYVNGEASAELVDLYLHSFDPHNEL